MVLLNLPAARDLAVFAVGAGSGALLAALLRQRPSQCAECTGSADEASGDAEWLALAHTHRQLRKRKPSQSNFRVTAIIVFELGGAARYTVGHNDESCNLPNSACAERAAFLHLAGLVRVRPRAPEPSRRHAHVPRGRCDAGPT